MIRFDDKGNVKYYGDMEYCCKCPRFRMHFSFLKKETEKSCHDGYLFCECWDQDGEDYKGGSSMVLSSFKISNDIRRKLVFSGSEFGNVSFMYDEIPKELSGIVQRYVKFRDCPLLIDDKDCTFHMERNLEEWSEDDEEEE